MVVVAVVVAVFFAVAVVRDHNLAHACTHPHTHTDAVAADAVVE